MQPSAPGCHCTERCRAGRASQQHPGGLVTTPLHPATGQEKIPLGKGWGEPLTTARYTGIQAAHVPASPSPASVRPLPGGVGNGKCVGHGPRSALGGPDPSPRLPWPQPHCWAPARLATPSLERGRRPRPPAGDGKAPAGNATRLLLRRGRMGKGGFEVAAAALRRQEEREEGAGLRAVVNE